MLSFGKTIATGFMIWLYALVIIVPISIVGYVLIFATGGDLSTAIIGFVIVGIVGIVASFFAIGWAAMKVVK